jgi:hypothetical protein
LNKLREAEILLSQGNAIGVACKKIGVSDVTYYRWRKEYGDLFMLKLRRQYFSTFKNRSIFWTSFRGGIGARL